MRRPSSDEAKRSRSAIARPVLEAFGARCAAVWPDLGVDREAFLAWIGLELDAIGKATPDKPHATDLYLAFGCIKSDPAALRAFDTHVLSQVARHVSRIDPSETFADDVRQELRERLLIATENSAPRIGAYRGHGPLGAWVRAAAIRTAFNLRRGRKPESVEHTIEVAEGDPEIDYVRKTHSVEFRTALEEVLHQIPKEDRDILRMHYLEEKNIEEVGRTIGTHRATIARRLHRIRDALLKKTGDELRERLDLEDDELRTLLAFARDEVDVSLTRILVPTQGAKKQTRNQ